MKYRVNSWLMGFLSLWASTALLASGFQNLEESSSYLGTAFSGTTAGAYDASTAFYNPAGIMQLNKHQMMASGTYIHGGFDYKHTSGTTPGSAAGTNDLTGKDNDDPAVPAVLPAIHYTKPLGDRMGFGFSVTSPFGLSTDYDKDARQRYHATHTQLITIDLNPSLAYQAAPWLSAGVGLSAQYIKAKLNNMLRGAGTDFEAKSTGDDWGMGWNTGLLFKFSDNTRLGLAYRSKVDYKLKGDAKFDGTPAALTGYFPKQKLKGNVTLPETITASLFHNIGSWDILADAAYTNWSRFKKLKLDFSPGFSAPTVTSTTTPQNYRDTWRFSVGTTYHLNQQWALRAGYMHDDSPVRNRDRTARLPDADRQWLAVGMQYRTNNDKLVFDLGYAHVFFEKDIKLNELAPLNSNTGANTSTAAINGKYDGKADLLGLQVAWNL